jgi:hypothetical protein
MCLDDLAAEIAGCGARRAASGALAAHPQAQRTTRQAEQQGPGSHRQPAPARCAAPVRPRHAPSRKEVPPVSRQQLAVSFGLMQGLKLECEVHWRHSPKTPTCHGLHSLRRTLSKDPTPTTIPRTPTGERRTSVIHDWPDIAQTRATWSRTDTPNAILQRRIDSRASTPDSPPAIEDVRDGDVPFGPIAWVRAR